MTNQMQSMGKLEGQAMLWQTCPWAIKKKIYSILNALRSWWSTAFHVIPLVTRLTFLSVLPWPGLLSRKWN